MSQADHLFALVLLLVAWLYPLLDGRRLKRRLSQLDEAADSRRLQIYRELLLFQSVPLVLIGGYWLYHSYPFSELGFRLDNSWRFWLGCLLTALVTVFYIATCLRIPQDQALKTKMQQQFAASAETSRLLPRSTTELKYWVLCCLSTVSEELVFRGFALWYLSALSSLLVASAVSCLLFAVAHSYQGFSGVVRSGIYGLLLLLLFLLSGSLWPVLVLHMVQDLFGGVAGYLSLAHKEQASSGQIQT